MRKPRKHRSGWAHPATAAGRKRNGRRRVLWRRRLSLSIRVALMELDDREAMQDGWLTPGEVNAMWSVPSADRRG